MRQTYLILTIFHCIIYLFPSVVQAQSTEYRTTEEIMETLSEANLTNALMLQHMAVIDLAAISNYEAALAVADSMLQQKLVEDSVDLSIMEDYYMEKAIPYILERTKTEQVVMINHTKHAGIHRAFNYQLLETLYEQGFHYLALDELDHQDTKLNERGYPTLENSFYLREPIFGELVRYALDMGFTVFPYKSTKAQIENKVAKSEAETLNLAAHLKHDPQAKIVVLGNFVTTYKNKQTSSYYSESLATNFEKHTHIRPLTIDQTIMSEHADFERENPFYSFIGYEKEPMVFTNDENAAFVNPAYKAHCDIQIFHPRSRYTENRPEWLMMGDLRTYHKVKMPSKLRLPAIVTVYHANEDIELAVPADVLEVLDRDQKVFLILKSGDYVVKWIGRDGSEILQERFFN